MKQLTFCVFAACFISCTTSPTYNIAFEGGYWYNGGSFSEEIYFSQDGILTRNKPSTIDTVINLQGQYIIPPFGDAHTHNLSDEEGLDEMINTYLNEGIFYVQVLTNHASNVKEVKNQFNSPETIDVIYANGGLTSTLGHPFVAFETSAMGLHWSAMFTQRDRVRNSRLAENDAYWFMDSAEEVHDSWEDILASEPDLLKIFLIRTDRHDELFNSENMGNFGLSKDVAEVIVKKAKEAGLKVYAHVETAYDFRTGLDIGVDGFGHMPGYSWDGQSGPEIYRLNDEDLKRAYEQNIVVTPTVNFARVYATSYDREGNATVDSVRLNTVNNFLREELSRFYDAGINIAIGSDQFRQTSMAEANYILEDLSLFDNETLLNLLTKITPQSIFPDRKIGEFSEGFEASFLALNENPLENWDSVKNISLRVKQGNVIIFQ